jgi:hypothetical protein
VTESFWGSLRYFNFYRAAVAAVFLVGMLAYPDTLNLGSHNPGVFMYTSATYLALAVVFHLVLRRWHSYFNAQLTLQVITDVVALTLLTYASSGIRSGLGVMPLISLAGAALVSRGTLTLFYAALASIAVLLEQAYWVLVFDAGTATFLQPGCFRLDTSPPLDRNRLARLHRTSALRGSGAKTLQTSCASTSSLSRMCRTVCWSWIPTAWCASKTAR